MKQHVTIQCPVCQTEIERDIVTRIDTRHDTAEKQQLLEGTLFSFECNHCGAKRQIDHDFMYLDRDLKVVVCLIPNLETRKAEMEEILTQFMRQSTEDLSQYSLRVVRTAATLVEKVTIFNEGLNDIVVEIVKLLTDGLFAKEHPEIEVHARYFYNHQGQSKLLYLTKHDQMLVDFHQSLVDFSEDKYHKAVREDYKGRFIVVDEHWAANLLENKPGDAVNELEEKLTPDQPSPLDQRRIQKALKKKKR